MFTLFSGGLSKGSGSVGLNVTDPNPWLHCKNIFGINSNIYLYKGHHTVRKKDDLDSFIKNRTPNFAL